MNIKLDDAYNEFCRRRNGLGDWESFVAGYEAATDHKKRGLRTKEYRVERVKWLATQEGLLWFKGTIPRPISGPGISPADHQWHQLYGKQVVEGMQRQGLYAKKTHWRGVNVVNMLREAMELL